eukprot:387744-Heterocapsa_arctica.AAC.1
MRPGHVVAGLAGAAANVGAGTSDGSGPARAAAAPGKCARGTALPRMSAQGHGVARIRGRGKEEKTCKGFPGQEQARMPTVQETKPSSSQNDLSPG